ncbi:MAG: hypothetical protein H0S79_04285 [Anaerolineaceae bacterium]|nr:hypothetical protein [Anaerolineaceae bacterium]
MAKESTAEWTQDTILRELRHQLVEQRPITLFNTYKGVPITYEAEIAMVHPSHVGVIVHPYQTVCIQQEQRTYIECKGIPELIRAHAVSIDFTNHVVLLDDLKIPHSISVDLYHSWIKPEKAVRVELDSDLGNRLEGDLLSLAVLSGNVVRLAVAVPEDFPYAREDAVELTFKLPVSVGLIQVGGVVRSLTGMRNRPEKRLEVEGNAIMQDEVALLAYIAQREDELMKDLDKTYKKLRHSKKWK